MDSETFNDNKSPTILLREKELLKGETVHTFKRLDEPLASSTGLLPYKLNAHFFYPDDFKSGEQRTTIVFFHGGKWDHQVVSELAPQALHFKERGAVTVLAEYRVSTLYPSSPEDAMEDGQSLLLWLRDHHAFLGVDPNKIVAAGAGSGAHICLCAAMNHSILGNEVYNSKPNALILYSALVDTTKKSPTFKYFKDKKVATDTSPSRCISRNLPPMIFYHSEADLHHPIDKIEHFAKKMQRKKNTCILYPFGLGTHSFFNFHVNHKNFIQSLESSDNFLTDHGFLDTAPEGTFISDSFYGPL